MIFNVEFSGTTRVFDNIDRLVADMRDKMLKTAMRATLMPIRDSAAAHVSVKRGTLRDSMDIKVTSKGTKGSAVYGVTGPRAGIKIPIRIIAYGANKGKLLVAIPTRYAHLVEFGHNVVVKGKVVGRVAPRPFMRKAWSDKGGAVALFNFETTMAKELDSWFSTFRP